MNLNRDQSVWECTENEKEKTMSNKNTIHSLRIACKQITKNRSIKFIAYVRGFDSFLCLWLKVPIWNKDGETTNTENIYFY